MFAGNITQKYSGLEAIMHDYLIAERALNLHAYILKVGHLSEILAEAKPRHLLDVGCGGGQSAMRLKELYPHLQLTGVDLSPGQIERANQRAQQKGLDLRFEVADAQSLPYPNASFDVVYSFGCAKHWPDPVQGFGESWRVLKPGGELLIADATSDATLDQVKNFYDVSGFPKVLKKPLAAILMRKMFEAAIPVQSYKQIVTQVGIPEDAVGQLPGMPAFMVRTRKPE